MEFKLYDKSKYPGLKCNFIWDIDEDAEGDLWLATQGGGISCFDGFSFTTYDTSDGLANNIVNTIIVSKDSSVWAGTETGLSKFKNNQFTNYITENGLINDCVKALLEDRYGNIFIGHLGVAGFTILTNNKLKNHPGKFNIHAFLECQSGEILMGGSYGKIYKYSAGKFRELDQISPNWLYENHISDILEDKDGNRWFCTNGHGIYRFLKGKFEKLICENNISVGSAMNDHEGSLWFGGDFGLNQVKQNRFISFGKKEGMISNFGLTVCEDLSGNICVGLSTPGLSIITPNKIKNLILRDSHLAITTNSIIPAHNGGLWIGTRNQAIYKLFNHEKIVHSPLDNGAVFSLFETDLQELWIGANGCIINFDNQKYTYYRYDRNSYLRSAATCITQRTAGEIWFGTYGAGLYRIQSEQITQDGIAAELKHGGINALYTDSDDVLWIGTDNLGLYRLKQGEYTNISVQDGLFTDRLFSILEDDSLNLWCSTNRGIFKVSKHQLNDFSEQKIPRINCTVYNHLDGMRASECNGRRQPSAWKARDGRLWFTSLAGVVTIDPNNIPINEVEPPVYIENISSQDSTYRCQDSPVQLSANERDIEIHYTALSFAVPERVHFKYRLLGYEKEWVEAGTRRTAYYTNLPQGKYTFHVIACNNDGKWNEAGAKIDLTISPFWWETWWAYGSYLAVLVLFIFWIVRRRYKRVLLKAQLQLQKDHASRLEELDRTKSRFFAGVSHEFRTPLTLIKAPLEDLLAEAKPNSKRNLLQMMLRSITRLERLVDQLLDLSQLQNDKLSLQARPVRLYPFLKKIMAAFESYAKRKNITLRFSGFDSDNSGQDSLSLYLDTDKMEKVFVNLLSNALKYTPSGGKVSLKSDTFGNDGHPQKIKITVQDTGIGIPAHALPHIFDYFYRYRDKNNQRESGTGIGLALVMELVKLHHGEIAVNSTAGRGSEFTISLLWGKDHLKPEELIDETMTGGSFAATSELAVQYDEHPPEDLIPELPVERLKSADLPTILLVEDNPDMQAYIGEFLAVKYQIIQAKDGQDGLNNALNEIPDLIVSDVMMPRMDGFRLCKQLKNNKLTSHIPIIILTAKGSPASKIEGLEHGAVDYLTKPFNKQELLLRIQNLLRFQQAQQEYLRQQLTAIDTKISRVRLISADEKFLQRALDIIEKNIHDSDFNAQIFAQNMGLSRTHLNRKLRGLAGQKTNEFIRLIRLKMAARLLSNKTGSVSEIAYEVGFNHLSYFASCFKTQYGVLPSDYIQ